MLADLGSRRGGVAVLELEFPFLLGVVKPGVRVVGNVLVDERDVVVSDGGGGERVSSGCGVGGRLGHLSSALDSREGVAE